MMNRPTRNTLFGMGLVLLLAVGYWASHLEPTIGQLLLGFFAIIAGSILLNIRVNADLTVYFSIGIFLGFAMGRASAFW